MFIFCCSRELVGCFGFCILILLLELNCFIFICELFKFCIFILFFVFNVFVSLFFLVRFVFLIEFVKWGLIFFISDGDFFIFDNELWFEMELDLGDFILDFLILFMLLLKEWFFIILDFVWFVIDDCFWSFFCDNCW